MECGGKIYFGNKNLNEEEVIMKNKKKNVFLAGLMVLMMIVSLLSGMNLSVAKAAALPDFSKMLKLKIIKHWDSEPEPGTKAVFNIQAQQKDANGVVKSVKGASAVVELSLDKQAVEYYNIEVSNDKKTWTANIYLEKTYQEGAVFYTVEEKATKVFTSSLSVAKVVTDDSTIELTNTRVKKTLTIKKEWNAGDEKTGTKLTLTANGVPAGEVLLYSGNRWEKQISLPVYDLDGNPIEYAATETKIDDETKKVTKSAKLVDDQDKPADKELIFNDSSVNKGNVQVTKTWTGTVGVAKFGLFKKGIADKLTYDTKVEETPVSSIFNVKFENVPLADELGNPVQYEIKELGAEDKAVANGDTLTLNNRNYRVSYDEKGNITNTEIIDGGNVVPVIPSTPVVPETTPLVPVVTPTVPETTPVVTVPDDTTPQGDANISSGNTETPSTTEDTNNNEDEDVLAIDEDEVPQGDAKIKDDTAKEAPVDVIADKAPKGAAKLPKTGGTVGGYLSILGIGILGLGLALRKRK